LSIASSDQPSRWAFGGAGAVMVVTAGIHGLGYREVTAQLATSSLEAPWQTGIEGLWLIFSLHVVIVGALFLVASVRPPSVSTTVLVVAGLVPAADTVMLYAFVGMFVGTVALAIAAVLVYVGVALRQRVGRSSEHGT